MSAGAVFLIVVVFAVLIFMAVLGVGFFSDSGRASAKREREDRIEAEKALTLSRQREKIATKALRSIANGAGQPVFEATDALDLIEGTYTKELN